MSNNTAIKQTKLFFPDISRLWAFSRNLTNQNLEINSTTKALTCNCTAEEVEKAVSLYGANQFEEVIGDEIFDLKK